MSALSKATQLARLASESPAWALLRAANAPVILAILSRHLGGEVTRLPVPVLVERVEDDLAELRSDFPDLRSRAAAYLTTWREQGFLVRRLISGTREETLELSDAAYAAMAFTDGLEDGQYVATASRLETILEQAHALNVATDPRMETRLAALEARRSEVDNQIEQVRSGHLDVISTRQAVEKAKDILALAAGVPGDFARVRREIEEINSDLMRKLVEDHKSRGAVLHEVFAGISRLDESDQGQSFDSFHSLISDPERSGRYDDDVEAIMQRDFVEELGGDEVHALRNLVPGLQAASRDVNEAKTALNRSLRRFVQSGEHDQARRVHQLLTNASAAALAAADRCHLYTPTNFILDQSLVAMTSVGEISLHDPSETRSVTPWSEHPLGIADVSLLEELAREVDIDFKELKGAVRSTLATQGAATIGEVLAHHPATQGLASVIGLLVLALRAGSRRLGTKPEVVEWVSPQGICKAASVPIYLFEEEP